MLSYPVTWLTLLLPDWSSGSLWSTELRGRNRVPLEVQPPVKPPPDNRGRGVSEGVRRDDVDDGTHHCVAIFLDGSEQRLQPGVVDLAVTVEENEDIAWKEMRTIQVSVHSYTWMKGGGRTCGVWGSYHSASDEPFSFMVPHQFDLWAFELLLNVTVQAVLQLVCALTTQTSTIKINHEIDCDSCCIIKMSNRVLPWIFQLYQFTIKLKNFCCKFSSWIILYRARCGHPPGWSRAAGTRAFGLERCGLSSAGQRRLH